MKKEKPQSAAKAAKKSIHERLVKELKTITEKLKKDGINTIVDIEKEAKKLAKKIVKGAKVDHPAEKETTKEKTVASEVEAPVKETAPAKPKVAVKPQGTKVVKPVNGSVTPEPVAAKPAMAKKTAQPKTGKK